MKKGPKGILVIDIGGSKIKALATGQHKPVEIPSGEKLSAARMVKAVRTATAGWSYDAVSIGFPGVVRKGCPQEDPPNLGKGWVEFKFRKAFGCPVRIINDAAMQALGSYNGGTMLFLGLGTGLGSTLIVDGVVHPMELGDLPFRKGRSYAQYLGKDGYKRLGKARWGRHARQAITLLKNAVQADYVVVGGGQAKHLAKLPEGAIRGENAKAFEGGFRLWDRKFRRKLPGNA